VSSASAPWKDGAAIRREIWHPGGVQPKARVLKPEAWPVWLGEQPADPPQLKALLAPMRRRK